MAITIRFDRIHSQRINVSTFCVRCKKRLKRTVREEQTLNPWNTIEENGVKRTKSRQEIWNECEAEVRARVAYLQLSGTLCRKCEELGTPTTPEECYVQSN